MSAGRSRDIRRLAFQALFQLDARSESEPEELRATLEEIAGETAPELSGKDVARALELALAAYKRRREADQSISDLAPAWPAPRQPAVDRAILRLAYHEMTSAGTSPKIVVNEAVELAKRFSTERSPAFVNGVLDKILKRLVTGVAGAEDEDGSGAGEEMATP